MRHSDSLFRFFRSFCESEYCNFLLLKISTVFFINKNKVQVIFHTELVVYVAMCGCQFVGAKEKPYWYGFTCKINHNLVTNIKKYSYISKLRRILNNHQFYLGRIEQVWLGSPEVGALAIDMDIL